MIDDLTLSATLRVQRGGAPSLWETCAALLPGVGADDAVVLVGVPGSYADLRLRQQVAATQLFVASSITSTVAHEGIVRGCWRDADSVDGPAVVLSDEDLDILPGAIRFWPGVPARAPCKVRRLDTLLDHQARLALLCIEAAGDAPKILKGAVAQLAARRTMIVIDLGGEPKSVRAALLETCVKQIGSGYSWYDGLLMPCNSASARAEMIGAFGESIFCCLPEPLVLSAAGTLASNGWKSRVARDHSSETLSVAFGPELPCNGFHPAESDGSGRFWRWSGPTSSAAFVMPAPRAGWWRLRFNVESWGLVKSPDNFEVSCQGEKLYLVRASEYEAVFGRINIPLGGSAGGTLRMDISTPRPKRASQNDPRHLGISLSRCTLEPWG